MTPLIEVDKLSKSFRQFTAVDQLSFTVNKGDIFGFLGQNGAGKSTTIRMLLTLIKPTSGTVSISGNDLFDNRNEVLKNIGAVIEKPDLYKYLSAYDNLLLFARMSGIRPDRNRLMEQLDMVGLADRHDSKVKTFSQGMKQRLGIAVAMVHDPAIIFLDEPTNGLDPQGIADMRTLIISLSKERNKTILVSSHLLNEIEAMANRMLIIHKGKKIVEGEVKSLLDPSKTIVTIRTGDNNRCFEIFSQLEQLKHLVNQSDVIRLETNKDNIPFLVSLLTENEVDVHMVQPSHSLEDYFINLTKSA